MLAIVSGTEGSTYRKPGAMMLIAPNGEYAGMISGGCLEGDLVTHAERVMLTGVPETLRYDLADEEGSMFGLGLGCGGSVDLLLQRIEKRTGFSFLPALIDALAQRRTCCLALVTQGETLSLGDHALWDGSRCVSGDERLIETFPEALKPWTAPSRWRHVGLGRDGGEDRALLVCIEPQPRVLICGAGPDALPLVDQVIALGWDCVVVDHRPAYANPARIPGPCRVILARPEELTEHVSLDSLSGAVVMSHNLEHDAGYLRQLSKHPPAYLGLLGPRHRREELLRSLGNDQLNVHGPAGLPIGAEMPEAIALSIMAEMFQVLARSDSRDDS